jgi:pyrroline-5-carboxylate reductase
MEKKISIAGLGKMGMALGKTMAKHGYEVHGFDVMEVKPGKTIKLMHSFEDLVFINAPVIIAVKPNQVAGILDQIKDNRLVISIAAGVSLKKLKSMRGIDGPTIRVMPNTPCVVNEGISAMCASSECTDEQKEFALEAFQTGGDAFYIQNENLMHAITGLSGSGPAYVELFIQALEDAGVLLGIPREMARRLAVQTVAGTAKLVQKSNRSPQDLIHDVTSPGGTTISGIETLKVFGFERAVMRAVKKAALKSLEISGEY